MLPQQTTLEAALERLLSFMVRFQEYPETPFREVLEGRQPVNGLPGPRTFGTDFTGRRGSFVSIAELAVLEAFQDYADLASAPTRDNLVAAVRSAQEAMRNF